MVFTQMTNFSRILLAGSCLAAALFLAGQASAQNPPAASPQPKQDAPRPDPQSRITIEVTGGEKETPVENASVDFKYVENHKSKTNKTMELNVTTNREGVATVADAPLGRVLIKVLAEGWKSYGRRSAT